MSTTKDSRCWFHAAHNPIIIIIIIIANDPDNHGVTNPLKRVLVPTLSLVFHSWIFSLLSLPSMLLLIFTDTSLNSLCWCWGLMTVECFDPSKVSMKLLLLLLLIIIQPLLLLPFQVALFNWHFYEEHHHCIISFGQNQSKKWPLINFPKTTMVFKSCYQLIGSNSETSSSDFDFDHYDSTKV